MITNSLGNEIDLFNLKPEDICLLDIITALPHICRYGGRCPIHYSVGQHSVELALYLLEEVGRPDLAKIAILHDACEAYLGDMIYPLKIQIPGFLELESELTEMVYKKFGVDASAYHEFHPYDRNISVNEMKALGMYESNKTRATVKDLVELPNLKIVPMSIEECRMLLIITLNRLNLYTE